MSLQDTDYLEKVLYRIGLIGIASVVASYLMEAYPSKFKEEQVLAIKKGCELMAYYKSPNEYFVIKRSFK